VKTTPKNMPTNTETIHSKTGSIMPGPTIQPISINDDSSGKKSIHMTILGKFSRDE
jgi:hypothetical protein